jgi:FkbM family methyltransferase
MEVNLRDGSKFRVRDRREELSDAYVINESYLYGIHDNILPYIRNAKIGIDVGAHIGTFSVFAAKRSPAKIFAVEPTETNLKVLKENIKLNGLPSRVVPLKLALAGKSGSIKLFSPKNGGLASTTAGHVELYGGDKDGPVAVSDVRALSLADFFAENNIAFCDFIKMDCEGGEYDILYNTLPETFKKIGIMSIECHADSDINQLMEFLRKRGFDVVRPTMEFGEIFCRNASINYGN